MSFILNRLVRYAARKVLFDPSARRAVTTVARGIAEEAKHIARDEDRARAAGRSFRRVLNRLQADPDDPGSEKRSS